MKFIFGFLVTAFFSGNLYAEAYWSCQCFKSKADISAAAGHSPDPSLNLGEAIQVSQKA
ncbi:MAG: hypothetical protein KDD45_00120 [Bdellovibrionales bacterium]|nr:hypothetical protein [Bdellovibrionales bacterium]